MAASGDMTDGRAISGGVPDGGAASVDVTHVQGPATGA